MDTREGGNIGLAVRTGQMAAESIIKGEQQGTNAETEYLNSMKSILSIVGRMHSSYIERQAQLAKQDQDQIFRDAVDFVRRAIE